MDYKTTLNLPKTDFPMKANLKDLEPRIIEKWRQEKIYGRMQEQAKGKKRYILHDGPPYANGHIHIGHALNKILKDIIVKYKSMQGFSSPYVPGWDCHGLPIEHQVLKNLGPKKETMSQAEIRSSAASMPRSSSTSSATSSSGSACSATGTIPTSP